MNIVEAYIKFKGQLLIFISGLSGCGKLSLAKNIARDFKLKLIDQFDYYKTNYDVTVSLPDGTTLINWYTDDAVDWNKFNEDIDKFKNNGLLVVGFSLPEDKITSIPDYHLHLNASKQVCMEKRKTFLENHKDKYEEEYKLIGTQTEKLKMNQLIFPYYLESIRKSKINKFINITPKQTEHSDQIIMSDDEIYDEAYNIIITFIKNYLYAPVNETSTETTKTPKVSQVSKTKKLYKKNSNGNEQKHRQDSKNEKFQRTTDSTTSATFELSEPDYIYDDKQNMDMVSALDDDFTEYDDGDGPIVALAPEPEQ